MPSCRSWLSAMSWSPWNAAPARCARSGRSTLRRCDFETAAASSARPFQRADLRLLRRPLGRTLAFHGWVVWRASVGTDQAAQLLVGADQKPGRDFGTVGYLPSTPQELYVAFGDGDSSSFDYGDAVMPPYPALRPVSFGPTMREH